MPTIRLFMGFGVGKSVFLQPISQFFAEWSHDGDETIDIKNGTCHNWKKELSTNQSQSIEQ